MNINYMIIALVGLFVIGLIIFLIRRNQKDEKTFEKEMNDQEIKPEQHKEKNV